MTLEPYQTKAVHWLSARSRGIIVAPAGAGKTILMAAALDSVLSLKQRSSIVLIGWMCHTLEQKQQAQAALDNFPELSKAATVTIECAAAETDWSAFDVLVVDEVHWAGCDQWSKQVLSCNGARWGMTATPFGDDPERNEFLLSLFDHNLMEIGRHEVVNRLVPAVVHLLDDTDAGIRDAMEAEIERTIQRRRHWFKGADWELRAQVTWHVCIKRGIVGNAARNAKVVELAKRHAEDSVLILVNEIEHGKELAERIPGSRMCFSKMGRPSRKRTLETFKEGEVKCIIGTSMLEEGFDAPRSNVLIVASGGRSERKATQTTGRVLRAFGGKSVATIYDFQDYYHPFARKHSLLRQAVYRKLGYEVIT